jgi:tetratricopeptide (TPR) repeat protein
VDLLRAKWLIVCICGLAAAAGAQDNKTVLGPRNTALQEGANALRAGAAEEGIRLTLIGLSQAHNAKERQTAQSNLCAGYALLGQYERGLSYCDAALADNDRNWRALSNRALIYIKLRRYAEADADLLVGEAISPGSNTIKAVRRMYLDATNPVAPSVVIDDRRDPGPGEDNAE